ncbi:hypothetical protein AFCDBAGC_4790 [Methylobacterium cerastii]|uniref:Uncharacterized protein n=1 Tax=Methylobacterium cerastii TaxID=932741 RepID=A0ABQ4QNQ7_9HYPH|nr:hypothetical protein AFCDBAGC_4790 [Methylobacterium cerastii]
MRYCALCLAALLAAAGPSAYGQESADIPAKKRNAAKLAGLVGFVNVNCSMLKTDVERFKGAVQSMGVDPAEIDRDALMLQARGYVAAYAKDVPASCSKAQELFGQRGRIIPGIFVPR